MKSQKLLHINSSGRFRGSMTRKVSDVLVTYLKQENPNLEIIDRDLAAGLPFVDESWINANFTAPNQRSDDQKETLHFSDHLVAEIQESEHLILAAPIYNFSIPAVLKAWIDQIARANLTFHYTETGPVGLLKGKKATVVMASGGVPIGSELDMASPYIKQALAFVGITDVKIVDASTVDEGNRASILA